jgi:hypothetical protein
MEMNIAAKEASLVWETSKRNLNAVVQGDFSPRTMAQTRSGGNKGALIFEL